MFCRMATDIGLILFIDQGIHVQGFITLKLAFAKRPSLINANPQLVTWFITNSDLPP